MSSHSFRYEITHTVTTESDPCPPPPCPPPPCPPPPCPPPPKVYVRLISTYILNLYNLFDEKINFKGLYTSTSYLSSPTATFPSKTIPTRLW